MSSSHTHDLYRRSTLTLFTLLFATALSACDDDSGATVASGDTSSSGLDTNVCVESSCPAGFSWRASSCQCTLLSDTSSAPDTTPPEDTTPLPITFPADPIDYQSGQVAYINSLALPPLSNGEPTCCKDFGAISRFDGVDNAVAKFLLDPAIEAQLQTNSTLALSISTGNLAILLDHHLLDPSPTDPDGFVLSLLQGRFAPPTTFDEASQGLGTFTINPESFIPNSGEPLTVFNPTPLTDGTLTTPPITYFFKLTLAGATLEVPIIATQINGALSQDANGAISYAPGSTLSGYIAETAFREAINQFFVSECACLSLTGPLYGNSSGWGPSQCMDSATARARCPNPSANEVACINLVEQLVCTVIPLSIRSNRDISTDEDPKNYEALSIGFTFTAVPALTDGITPRP